MSCGRPHSTPCDVVLSNLYEYLADEIDAVMGERIVVHLEECPPCVTQLALEQMVQSLVRRACLPPQAPEHVRMRVVQRITEIRVTYGRELP